MDSSKPTSPAPVTEGRRAPFHREQPSLGGPRLLQVDQGRGAVETIGSRGQKIGRLRAF